MLLPALDPGLSNYLLIIGIIMKKLPNGYVCLLVLDVLEDVNLDMGHAMDHNRVVLKTYKFPRG